ncbi:MAG TPA: TadE/TadG family type IV pilus assembly protein [Allosphingosinicella sp.]|nr:TadE/TadG family type IV pilus assembly protein [Allosphingosinicella sp.]
MSLTKRDKIPGRGTRRGLLARLRRDERGNTLAMMAAALIPMIGMVGSAVDISRAYLVKTRLQQACDAGVLAARRTMTGQSVANDTNAKTQATNFFNINLKTGAYGATVTPITVSDVAAADGTASGTIDGTASATVPTILMKIFGKTTITMTATCEAELQVSNQDVMFVLDVTGSMDCPAATPSCTNNNGVEATNSKIGAVRTGVVSFYDTLSRAMTGGSQLRIGFVPYSSNVNVGKLLPAADLVDSWTYQSRQKTLVNYSTSNSYNSWTTTSTGAWSSWSTSSTNTNVQQSSCSTPSSTTVNGSTTETSGTTTTDSSGVKTTPLTDTRTDTDSQYQSSWVKTGTDRFGRSIGTCTIQVQTRTRTEQRTGTQTQTPNYTWTYEPVTYDTSQYKLGNSVTTTTGSNQTDVSSTWDGCIEERQTVSNATFSTIPSDAYDLQIDLLPTDDTTKWKPAWETVIYGRPGLSAVTDTDNGSTNNLNDYFHPTSSNTYYACPKAAQRLAVMSHDDVYNYVNASDFKAIGGTYHDVGMLWGARLLSPTGIFSADNATAPNGEPINRNIVFMTDGDMAPNPNIYGLYGYEMLDRRVSGTSNTPTASDLKSRHNSRFSAICTAIKNLNITIWVIAYDQTMTTELQNCASPGKSFYAADDASLNTALQTIAEQIAELRLSK